MNIIDSIKALFPPTDINMIVSEKYSTFKIQYSAIWPPETTISAVQESFKEIRDNWSLTAQTSDDDPTSISSQADIAKESEFLNRSIGELQGRGEFKLTLDVLKAKENGATSVYSFLHFDAWVNEIGPVKFLDSVANDAKTDGLLQFELLNDGNLFFRSCKFVCASDTDIGREIAKCPDVIYDKSCDFNRRNDFPFSPAAFRLVERSAQSTKCEQAFDCLFATFLLAGIFDTVKIDSDKVAFRLIGFKIIDWEIPINDLVLSSAETYWKIHEWIYSEPTKVADKLGLTRNILSTYLKADSLEIDETAYQATISGYNVYLKDNLSKYLDLRSKIHDELSEISQKANEVIGEYFSNYQKSAATILSFFITVFIVRFFSAAKEGGIFNREATILTFCFLGVSILYLTISLVILWKEQIRLQTRYDRLKARFKDLLHENDIKAILSDDEEYNDEVRFLKSRRFWYTLLWVSTVLALAAVVLSLSTYMNWETLFSRIASFWALVSSLQ
jgi:hypothetical protein